MQYKNYFILLLDSKYASNMVITNIATISRLRMTIGIVVAVASLVLQLFVGIGSALEGVVCDTVDSVAPNVLIISAVIL